MKNIADDSRKQITTSPDGKWETFHKNAGLMRYVPSGVFFARLKINGKRRLETLDTESKTVAIDRLAIKRQLWRKSPAANGTMEAAMERWLAVTEAHKELCAKTKEYRARCLKKIKLSWPQLATMRADKITEDNTKAWWEGFKDTISGQYANNLVCFLGQIMKLAGVRQEDNPFRHLEKRALGRKPLTLPNQEQFDAICRAIETGHQKGRKSAFVVRFLAYSGCRISEANQVTWGDIDWQKNEIKTHCAKRQAHSKESPLRFVPMVPAMQALLKAEMSKAQAAGIELQPTDRIYKVRRVSCAISTACQKTGVPHLCHHSFRHLFATFCIEAGIDIPTVSRWLGHSDGGTLAMRTYGHLRREHSQLMAQRVTFGLPAVPQAVLASIEPKQLTTVTV